MKKLLIFLVFVVLIASAQVPGEGGGPRPMPTYTATRLPSPPPFFTAVPTTRQPRGNFTPSTAAPCMLLLSVNRCATQGR